MIKPSSIKYLHNYIDLYPKKEYYEEKTYKKIYINFSLKSIPEQPNYIEWYIKCEGVNPLFKDIIDMDISSIEQDDEKPSLSFRINKYFCKKNGLHIKFIDGYMVVPIMTSYSYYTYIRLDIFIKNNFNRYSATINYDYDYESILSDISLYSDISFWEKSFIKIPCKENQKLIPYKYDCAVYFNCNNKYIIIEVDNDDNNIYNLLDTLSKKYVKIDIKVKPKRLKTFIIFKNTLNEMNIIYNIYCNIDRRNHAIYCLYYNKEEIDLRDA